MGAPLFDNSYVKLPELFHAATTPAPAPAPKMVRLNETLAADLGLDVEWLRSERGLGMFAGTDLPGGSASIAMAYAGHQFGGYSPRLGDGRAYLLGEVLTPEGERFDLHLKGSGPTAFSRRGDGKATLSSVLREFIVSEAMHHLGVPTSRALAAITTGEVVRREEPNAGAIFARVARSHVRVGTFQYAHASGSTAAVRQLADYIVERHYPAAAESEERYRALFEAALDRQASLVAHWMSLGFIHGVMNTDNVQIAGETIDYGPCAFMDVFHPQKKFSSIDRNGRYAWGNQPAIAQWNMTRFAETLLPLVAESQEEAIEWAQASLDGFRQRFAAAFLSRFRKKLGVAEGEKEDALVDDTFALLAEERVDFTLFFRELARAAQSGSTTALEGLFAAPGACHPWTERWRGLLLPDAAASMLAVNPAVIPRNHRVEAALEAADGGDYSPFERLMDVLARPFADIAENAEFERAPAPDEVVAHTFCGT